MVRRSAIPLKENVQYVESWEDRAEVLEAQMTTGVNNLAYLSHIQRVAGYSKVAKGSC
jgi:hypothetical protein